MWVCVRVGVGVGVTGLTCKRRESGRVGEDKP